VPPEPPPPSGEWEANRPGGLTTIENWDGIASTNWEGGSTGSSVNFTDATAPYSPDKVARFVYPNAFTDGYVGSYSFAAPANTVRLYSSTYLRFSSNFNFHDPVKFWYLDRTTGLTSGSVVWGFQPIGNRVSGGIQLNVQPQTTNGPQNVGSGALSVARDEWFLLETLLVMNTTTGTSDGVARAWVNGTQVINQTNMRFSESGDPLEWRMHMMDPYYGGGADTPISGPIYLYIDQSVVAYSTSRS
jgi:hypothetical protein